MTCAAHALAASRSFLRPEDVDLIQKAVAFFANEPLRVVDLGGGSGTTALAVLCARPDAIVTTVDRRSRSLDWVELAVRNEFPDADWLGIEADAADGAMLHQQPNVTLLLHDAGHEATDVERDLAAWLPKVTSTGLVWVHDYAGKYPGVAEAIDRLCEDGTLLPIETAGLGWLGTKGPRWLGGQP